MAFMKKLNVEFKARIDDIDKIREQLRTLKPRELGVDHQRDTYFEVPEGRLKLREGNIEQSLIFYRRSNQAETRESHVVFATVDNADELRRVLVAALPVKGVVQKDREIYYLDETKVHLDRVAGYGTFLEVESPTVEEANRLFTFFAIRPADVEGRSYSDFAQTPIVTDRNNLL